MRAAENTIEQVRKDLGLDRRSSVFEVHAVVRAQAVTVLGHATEDSAVEEVLRRLRSLDDVQEVIDEVVRLPGLLNDAHQHALVRAAVAPMYDDPRVPAPQITQVVLGGRVDLLFRQGVWWRVRAEDGYIGWIHAGYLMPGSKEWTHSWERATGGTPVVSLGSELLSGDGDVIARLPWGARLFRTSPDVFRLADGRTGRIGGGEVVAVDRLFDRFPPLGDSVTRTAVRWLGAPYLWGGVTMGGVDCSGLTQAVLWMHGVGLPRDSDLQARVGVKVETPANFSALRSGDLLYFSEAPDRISHVAISLGGSRIVHSALTNGQVATNDLLGESAFEQRLRSVFTSARRLLPDS
jgi:gamma-D-glutamyl-L-lysine dipeptidyl-peptidase